MMVIAIVVLGGATCCTDAISRKKWGIDPDAKTPAYEMEDGVDYVPGDTNVVFGHQFASIAGAGPINGPIQAAIFGWLPVLSLDPDRRRILRCSTGFLRLCTHPLRIRDVRSVTLLKPISEKLGKNFPAVLLAVLYSGCCSICRRRCRTFNGFAVSEAGEVSRGGS